MDYTDYAACARAAEVQANIAKCPEIAANYRDLAKCYQALAEQCEHMSPRYHSKPAEHLPTNLTGRNQRTARRPLISYVWRREMGAAAPLGIGGAGKRLLEWPPWKSAFRRLRI